MTTRLLPDNLPDLQAAFDYFWTRIQAIEKNKGTDRFCKLCFQGTAFEKTCPHCGGDTQDKYTALVDCRNLASIYGAELRQMKARFILGSGSHSDSSGEPTDGEEPVTINFPDGTSQNYPNAKKARKALRDRGLSVTQVTKDGQFWKF